MYFAQEKIEDYLETSRILAEDEGYAKFLMGWPDGKVDYAAMAMALGVLGAEVITNGLNNEKLERANLTTFAKYGCKLYTLVSTRLFILPKLTKSA